MDNPPSYEALVIGASAGGIEALCKIFSDLREDFPLAIIIVQHRAVDDDGFLCEYLNKTFNLNIKEAQPYEKIKPQWIYLAPAGYHLLVERDKTLSLSTAPPVNYAIPSINVLFESAAVCYKNLLIGVILTGGNNDGSAGLLKIKQQGGLTLVQDPLTATVDVMPKEALKSTEVDNIIALNDIANFINRLKGSSDGCSKA